MTDALLTVPQVAALTNLHDDTIRRAIHDGELKAVRLRGRWRIPREAFDAWLGVNTNPQDPASKVRVSRLPDRPRSVSLPTLERRASS